MTTRYTQRLIAAGSAPDGALVEPLVKDPPPSPLGEHELIPQVAWIAERDGVRAHVMTSDADLELIRASAELAKLDGELANETLDDLPGFAVATTGEFAAELLLDRDHLAALHEILRSKVYLAAAPRRGRLVVGGVGGGIEGMRAFVDHIRREHDAAAVENRVSPVALLVRDAAPTAVVAELQLAALERAKLAP